MAKRKDKPVEKAKEEDTKNLSARVGSLPPLLPRLCKHRLGSNPGNW